MIFFSLPVAILKKNKVRASPFRRSSVCSDCTESGSAMIRTGQDGFD